MPPLGTPTLIKEKLGKTLSSYFSRNYWNRATFNEKKT